MQLSSKDPDIQTILNWITDERIDLEPDFQRGDVWNLAKKQLLIDTILRDWQMPPIFIIVDEETLIKNVLDGHQRLTTIYQFSRNEFAVNGCLQPPSDAIEKLDGMLFRSLPERQRRKFLDFSIRVFEITNHQRDEPFELFYRLNEGVKLTAAERRNTFYGALRGQVKKLVDFWEEIGLNSETLGFANARLAYHDVVARTIIHLETRNLGRKLTDKEITDRYRQEKGASISVVDSVRYASVGIKHALEHDSIESFPLKLKRFSKPTLFSLLYFISSLHQEHDFVIEEEPIRLFLKLIFNLNFHHSRGTKVADLNDKQSFLFEFFEFYRYRSSTSVNDARALIIRDYFMNYAWDYLDLMSNKEISEKVRKIKKEYSGMRAGEDALFLILQHNGWGTHEKR